MSRQPHRAAMTFGYAAVGVIVLMLALGMWGWVRYWQLEATVDQACRSTLIRLDVTSWAPVCRVVQPEDLDR